MVLNIIDGYFVEYLAKNLFAAVGVFHVCCERGACACFECSILVWALLALPSEQLLLRQLLYRPASEKRQENGYLVFSAVIITGICGR